LAERQPGNPQPLFWEIDADLWQHGRSAELKKADKFVN
jgi:hypothetical protein